MKGDDLLEAVWDPSDRPSRHALGAAAAFMLLPPAIFAAGLISGIFRDWDGGVPGGAILLFIAFAIAVLLTLPALAVLQADVRRNESLTARRRNWWLGSVLVVPGAPLVYWMLHHRR